MNEPNQKHLDYIASAFRSELFFAIAEGDMSNPIIQLAISLTESEIMKSEYDYISFDNPEYTAKDHIKLGKEILRILRGLI